jgi:hypothetical protein
MENEIPVIPIEVVEKYLIMTVGWLFCAGVITFGMIKSYEISSSNPEADEYRKFELDELEIEMKAEKMRLNDLMRNVKEKIYEIDKE